ncbi:MAG: hypothetical protein IJW94_07070 [Oscillospiraceae bacterium]|nr:hypothetical protein [Oscillospiraceae bacterium]
MNNFVLLSDFPNNAKAIGPVFSAFVYYSFDKKAYFTPDDDLLGEIHINEDGDCTIGTPLFVVSAVNDKGKFVKSDENAFYQSVLNGRSGLESHLIMEPNTIIKKLSDLKELAIKKLRESVNLWDCDAFWATSIMYCFDEASKTIGYEITGRGYVINNTPNFEKFPELIKVSYDI